MAPHPQRCDVLSAFHVAGHLHVPRRRASDTSRILGLGITPCASDTATPVALDLTAPVSLGRDLVPQAPIQYACPWTGHGSPLPFLQKERNNLCCFLCLVNLLLHQLGNRILTSLN
ncbi:hypothetical protein PR202_ga02716 [Eleusine coracana subsp. coracana]|uniref:Uncharacterized protein n=1 Tax=Eleusine coracana subsp. coracana TaxID=191504 RepID=A0AAV5BK80_ELECO|nr:hypothetical protein PR202_ga02716 [Eleusine coracana subsp. coracana]